MRRLMRRNSPFGGSPSFWIETVQLRLACILLLLCRSTLLRICRG
jgi:hypothetical protein